MRHFPLCPHGPRRLAGLLIPGAQLKVHARASYSQEQAREAIAGRLVYLLEAKRHINRNVIGQVGVGIRMLREAFEPSEIGKVAVCTDGNWDLEPVCESMGNLFAWIYGDQPEAFRVATWERYVDSLDLDVDEAE